MTEQTVTSNPKLKASFLERIVSGISVSSWGGTCPYQAKGKIDEYPFYFRARGDEWTLEVLVDRENQGEYQDWPESKTWFFGQDYHAGLGAAGHITDDEFAGFINIGAVAFRDR